MTNTQLKGATTVFLLAVVQRCLDVYSQSDNDDWQCPLARFRWSARDYLADLAANYQTKMKSATSENIAGEAAVSMLESPRHGELRRVRSEPVRCRP
jgi:hypothetical protein